MARIRTIKPDFWTDEKLTECSLSARLLFIGTWNFADDKGNLQASAKKLKMQIFPADNINCQELLDELITHGLLIEYSVSGEKYLHIKNFSRHQVINRPSHSDLPLPPFIDDSLSTHTVITEPSLREGKGKEGKGINKATSLPKDFSISDAVRAWAKEKGHTRLEERLEHFTGYAIASGKKYVNWDMAFMNAIRGNWAKLEKEDPFGDVIYAR